MIAIDPGSAGGIVAGNEKLNLGPTSIAMPKTHADVVKFLAPGPVDPDHVAYLEDLVKFTGSPMPSSAMAVYASNWGIIKGALLAYGYRVVLVPPKKWQKALGLGAATGMSKTEWKNKLKARAQELYPKHTITLSTADAFLIYEAAKLGLLG